MFYVYLELWDTPARSACQFHLGLRSQMDVVIYDIAKPKQEKVRSHELASILWEKNVKYWICGKLHCLMTISRQNQDPTNRLDVRAQKQLKQVHRKSAFSS